MKKITYLVAPLMVLPFLVGCGGNKAKTHKVEVADWSSEGVKFTDKNGKAFTEKSKVTHGKDFTFHVEAIQANDGETYTVFEEGVFIGIGETMYLGEYNFVYDNDDKTSATITIPGVNITNDVTLAGAEWRTGYYICELPLIAGTEIKSIAVVDGEEIDLHGGYFAYFPTGEEIKITFDGADGKDIPYTEDPYEAGIALGVDDAYVYTVGEAYVEEWANYEADGNDGALTISGDAYEELYGQPIHNLILMARGSEYEILEDLSWETIKLISDWGYAKTIFNYGDVKTIKVNGKDHKVKLIGFNHDLLADGSGLTNITFQFETLVSDADGNAIKTPWKHLADGESTYNANYDFINSTLNSKMSEVFDMLPNDLQDAIVPVTKSVGEYNRSWGGYWEIKTYEAKLFPLCHQEQSEDSETPDHVVEGETGEYPYFPYGYLGTYGAYKDVSTETRAFVDANGNELPHWTRSPATGTNGTRAWAISVTGELGSQLCYHASEGDNQFAMAPAFAI